MNKFELADLILRYLSWGKEQRENFTCTDSKTLAKELKDAGLPVTEEQVDKAVKYLYEREFIKGPKGSIPKPYGIQYSMNKFELADLILRYLSWGKEQRENFTCTDSKTLAKELKDAGLPVTEEQVDKAVKYLYEREFIKGTKGKGIGVLLFSITPKGEDVVDSGLSVQEAIRRTFETSPTNTTNTTIHGNVNQFAQGDNNTQIQNNHVETADELFEKLIELLKQYGETKIADEAKAEKESGGIRKAAKFISDKILSGFLTKLGQDGTQQVMAALGAITLALPQ
ncbi:hypothetical protein [Corynebacterium matruchotii]|uniref:hypothetical protein n=1 Tax=Corynebacterium matruchotii TaxID=43768 RepID=UPI0028D2F877|nr:hypothetical protein [Corynebacterium matruchotii]